MDERNFAPNLAKAGDVILYVSSGRLLATSFREFPFPVPAWTKLGNEVDYENQDGVGAIPVAAIPVASC